MTKPLSQPWPRFHLRINPSANSRLYSSKLLLLIFEINKSINQSINCLVCGTIFLFLSHLKCRSWDTHLLGRHIDLVHNGNTEFKSIFSFSIAIVVQIFIQSFDRIFEFGDCRNWFETQLKFALSLISTLSVEKSFSHPLMTRCVSSDCNLIFLRSFQVIYTHTHTHGLLSWIFQKKIIRLKGSFKRRLRTFLFFSTNKLGVEARKGGGEERELTYKLIVCSYKRI